MRWTIDGVDLEAESNILKRLNGQFGFGEWTKAAVRKGDKEN